MTAGAGDEPSSDAGRLNFEWARAILAVLVRECGLKEVEIAPGSRSAPLVLAAHSIPQLSVRVHLDERCAGFFALGYARTHLGPAAVVTTSGTAVANLLPAVVEADQSDVPMLLITADRPPALRGSDANQTIVQPGIFGERVRGEVDLPLPTSEELRSTRPSSMLAAVRRAGRRALGPPAGPCHINVPFSKPLEPESLEDGELAVRGPAPDLSSPGLIRRPEDGGGPESNAVRPDDSAWSSDAGGPAEVRRGRASARQLASFVEAARRPLLVAGPSNDPGGDGPAIVRFAAAFGVPALADPLSGARFDANVEDSPTSLVLGAYDHFLRVDDVVRGHVPDLIIRVGRTPTSAALQAALPAWSRSHQVVIDHGAHRKDHQRLARHYLHARAGDVLAALAGETGDGPVETPPPTPWTRAWRELEAATWAALAERDDSLDEYHEGDYARAVAEALPFGATLFTSSSMPVRDLDAYARPAPRGLQVLGNRGASGIDGIVSTALGCAAGGAWPLVALVGDIAFYHDMNGLLAARDRDLNVTFVVIDNDGGGIFHMLPIRDFEPVFTPCFATPHGLDFRHAAHLYGLRFADAASPAELKAAVGEAVQRPGAEVIRVRTDRHANWLGHVASRERVARRLQGALPAASSPLQPQPPHGKAP